MTVSLALVDYIPVILFAITGITIMREFYSKMSKGAFALTSAGIIMVVWAGAYKATWKLFYTMGVADFYLMNSQFLPMQAAGFLNLAIGLCAATFLNQGEGKTYSFVPLTLIALVAAPPENRAAFLFIIFMVLGYLGFCGAMTVNAVRAKKPLAVALFIVSFVLLMGMGYLGSREFGNDPTMNWVEEGINTAAQTCLLIATLNLTKK